MFSLLARLDERHADDLFPEWVPVWLPPLLWLLISIALMIAGLIMMQRETKVSEHSSPSPIDPKSTEDFIALFKAHDDPVRWEYPRSMDYEKQVARFRRFAAELERRLGTELEVETESQIQDANFHSQIRVEGVLLRFSNFGGMVATTDDDSIAPSTLNVIKELAETHGYIFIPHDLLEVGYSGRNPGVTSIRNWWIRYFDWM